MTKNKQGKSYNKAMIHKFILIVLAMVGCFVLVSAIAVYAFIKPGLNTPEPVDYTKAVDQEESDEKEKKKGFVENLLLPPEKTNVLILCTNDNLADTMIFASFDRDSLEINLVSIPRDLYTEVLDDVRTRVKTESGRNIPSVVKINELHSWAGTEWGPWAVKTQLQSMFDIQIDYTVRINLEAFRKIIDLVGPIEMEIPAGGLHYWDPTQNLRINVPGGLQQLDGEMAEGVVRFRATYGGGDLQRIQVQQEFMKLLFAQVINDDNLIENAAGISSTLVEYVETDFKFESLYRYVPYASKLKAENLKMSTIPGYPDNIYKGDTKISYFFHNEDESKELFKEILGEGSGNDPTDNTETLEGTENTSGKTRIQVLNTSANSNYTDEIITKLEDAGYAAEDGGKYSGSQKDYTRIMVRDAALGEEIQKYFPNSVVTVDNEIPKDADVLIILGTR